MGVNFKVQSPTRSPRLRTSYYSLSDNRQLAISTAHLRRLESRLCVRVLYIQAPPFAACILLFKPESLTLYGEFVRSPSSPLLHHVYNGHHQRPPRRLWKQRWFVKHSDDNTQLRTPQSSSCVSVRLTIPRKFFCTHRYGLREQKFFRLISRAAAAWLPSHVGPPSPTQRSTCLLMHAWKRYSLNLFFHLSTQCSI